MNAFKLNQGNGFLYAAAMAVSLVLSFWLAFQETVINPDAICYLLSAKAMNTVGLKAGMHICPQAIWPMYSVLIAGLVKITTLSYTSAAYVLDALFSLISVVTFISIVKALGGSKRVMMFAALVILLAHEFNSVRQYIIRDHGFWAFYLVSLYFLLDFFRQPKWLNALGFNISLIIAALFRIEGAIFLLALPFLSWFCSNYPWRQRARLYLMLNLLTILAAGLLILVLCLLASPDQVPGQSIDKLGRVTELFNQLQHGWLLMINRYHVLTRGLAEHVLTQDSASQAGLVLGVMFAGWYLACVIVNLSLVYTLLVVYAWCQKTIKFVFTDKLVLAGYLFLNVVITLGFLLEHIFLSKRYLMALSLVLMLWVPFALAYIKRRLWLGVAIMGIVISAIGGIVDFGYSKSYIQQAGQWMAINVPANASVYANDIQLMYYSQHFGNSIFKTFNGYKQINAIAHGQWKQYDYLALRVGGKESGPVTEILHELPLTPVQAFMNKRGDKVVIFSIGEKH